MKVSKEAFYNNVHNYTKYKLVDMLIKKYYKDTPTFKNLNQIEEMADDILDVLGLCGMKFYGEIKHSKSK